MSGDMADSGYSVIEISRDAASGLYSWLLSLCCSVACTTTTVDVNKRTLRVVRLLAEGGFSFVYLVEGGGEKFALKKVLCQLPEQTDAARWEIKVHTSIKHPNCMPLVDHCAAAAPNGAEEFRLLMPLYPHGTLLDKCVKHMQDGTRIPERKCLEIFLGVLEGVAAFHEHDPPWAHRDIKPANVLLDDGDTPVLMDFGSVTEARKTIASRTEALLLQVGLSACPPLSARPPIGRSLASALPLSCVRCASPAPRAELDAAPPPPPLSLQEDCAQNCSMPYRAPELFDVPSDATIDERTDVFSLGANLCTRRVRPQSLLCQPLPRRPAHRRRRAPLEARESR